MPRTLYAPKWLDKEVLFNELSTYVEKPMDLWRIRFYCIFDANSRSVFKDGEDYYYKFTRYSNPAIFWMFYTAMLNRLSHSNFFYGVLPISSGIHVSGTKERGGLGKTMASKTAIYTFIPEKLVTVSIKKRRLKNSYCWELTERGKKLGQFIEDVFIHPKVAAKFQQLCVLIKQEKNLQRARYTAKKYFPATFQKRCGTNRFARTLELYDVTLPSFPEVIDMGDVAQVSALKSKMESHYKSPKAIVKIKPKWSHANDSTRCVKSS